MRMFWTVFVTFLLLWKYFRSAFVFIFLPEPEEGGKNESCDTYEPITWINTDTAGEFGCGSHSDVRHCALDAVAALQVTLKSKVLGSLGAI